MYAVRTYLRMTRTPLLWVFQSLWSYVLTTATLMVFLILGLGQWMFELEHTISMFDSFLCGCCRLSASCDFYFPGRAAVNHAVWLVYTIPGAVICPYSTGYLLLGLIIICFKVCGWMLLRFLRLLRSDTFSHFGESIQFLGGLSSLSKHARGFNVQSLRRAAMSTTPSGRYNTIPRVVALIYRVFLTWIGFFGFRDGVVEIYSFAFSCTLSISMVLSFYMYRIDFLLES
jgi:hypothetical protein